jgi:hypothetical protein
MLFEVLLTNDVSWQSLELRKDILNVLVTVGLRWKKQISSFGTCKTKSYSDDREYIQNSSRIIYRRLNIVLFRIYEIQCDKICLFRIK